MKNFKFIIIVSFFLFIVTSSNNADALVSIDHVEGLNEDGSLITEDTVKFHFRFYLDYDNPNSVKFNNNFKIFSPDEAQWHSTNVNNEMLYNSNQINFNYLLKHDYNSNYEKITTKFNIKKQFINNLAPSNFDMVTFSISLVIPSEYESKTICIDINSIYKKHDWYWKVSPGNNYIEPEWNGPVCFLIGGNCCQGIRGNADNDSTDFIDILDLTLLVEYLYYNGKAPICFTEADLNGDNIINMSDIMFLSDYIFSGQIIIIPDCIISN